MLGNWLTKLYLKIEKVNTLNFSYLFILKITLLVDTIIIDNKIAKLT